MSDSVRSHRQQPTRRPRPWDSPGKNTGVCCHFLLQCMKVKSESEVAQSCLTLSDPMDCSPPGSSIHGIFQARVLEWGVIAFSVNFVSKCLLKWPSYFAFPSAMNERSCCSILLPTLGIVCVLDFSHCNRYVMVSSCFNLHFPSDMLCWKSLQTYVNHVYMYFVEMSVETFGTF